MSLTRKGKGLFFCIYMQNKSKAVGVEKMSLILARENASNLLDTCSRTSLRSGVRATSAEVKINTSVEAHLDT